MKLTVAFGARSLSARRYADIMIFDRKSTDQGSWLRPRTRRRLWLSCLLLIAVATSASCRVVSELSDMQAPSLKTGVVRGTVVGEPSGAAIVGATLILGGRADTLSGSEPRTYSYPPDGAFRFTGVPPGSYVIRATAEGYATLEVSVILKAPNEIVSVRIGLHSR